MTGLNPGATYTYKAYSDSTCTTEIASETFTTPASLTASSITATTATLTIAGHAGAWRYKADKAPHTACSSAVSTTTKDLAGLSAGTTYTYTAYSDSTCTSEVADETFTTSASLTASSITKTTATLTLAGHTGNWWLKKTAPTPAGTCTAGEADFSHALTSLTTGATYTYKAYSASGCASANEIASETFTTTPNAPQNVGAQYQDGSLKVWWDKPSGAQAADSFSYAVDCSTSTSAPYTWTSTHCATVVRHHERERQRDDQHGGLQARARPRGQGRRQQRVGRVRRPLRHAARRADGPERHLRRVIGRRPVLEHDGVDEAVQRSRSGRL